MRGNRRIVSSRFIASIRISNGSPLDNYKHYTKLHIVASRYTVYVLVGTNIRVLVPGSCTDERCNICYVWKQ